MPINAKPLRNKSRYVAPNVQQVAPDALIFVQQKQTILGQYLDENGDVKEKEIDFMNFVSSISVTKSIDGVPGSASFSLAAPLHLTYQMANPVKNSFSTLQEVEIYMKGRFLLGEDQEPAYYPVFWGIITSVSEGFSEGSRTINISCQDMMRWLQVTKVSISPSAVTSAYDFNPNPRSNVLTPAKDEKERSRSEVTGVSSVYVGVTPFGVVRDLLKISTGENFFSAQNIPISDSAIVVGTGLDPVTVSSDELRSINEIVISDWKKRFDQLGASLYIYGFSGLIANKNYPYQVDNDVLVDPSSYASIFDSELNVQNLRPFGVVGADGRATEPPQAFVTLYENRLDVAKRAAEQINLEFFQDMDGTIVLKPPFYNLDVRQNPFYVIEDIDIIGMNFVEDETQIITRLDVTTSIIQGGTITPNIGRYGFAIDYDKFLKYGMRLANIETNFITDNKRAATYATQELSRRNSLALNGSLRIQGRPELKLGYPVYIPSRDAFYYLTGISHSFSFGGSFETELQLTAGRRKRFDSVGQELEDLAVIVSPSSTDQVDNPGKVKTLNNDNPALDSFSLCDTFDADDVRPEYRNTDFDKILENQGTFRFVKNRKVASPSAIEYNITDDEAYTLIGSPFHYARDKELNENFEIIDRKLGSRSVKLATQMTVQKSTYNGFQRRLTLKDLQGSTNSVTNDKNKQNVSKGFADMKPKSIGNGDGE